MNFRQIRPMVDGDRPDRCAIDALDRCVADPPRRRLETDIGNGSTTGPVLSWGIVVSVPGAQQHLTGVHGSSARLCLENVPGIRRGFDRGRDETGGDQERVILLLRPLPAAEHDEHV